MSLLYTADPVRGRVWKDIFAAEAPEIDFRIWPEDRAALETVRYLVSWVPPVELLPRLTSLEVIFSIGAGIDQLDPSTIPPHVEIVRMVEPGIAEGMAEYVTFATLALHRHMLDYRTAQAEARWAPVRLVAAAERRVGIMGLGHLARRALSALAPFGFPLSAWSRSPHELSGIDTFSGQDGLAAFLARTDILVCLLPLTDGTRGILCRDLFEQLPKGAMLVNVGRGGHLVEQDLLDALESGRLGGAVLDVADPEPLPPGHAFWRHPRILLTPHIASMTRTEGGARALIDNMRRHASGLKMEGLVDRSLGY